MTDRNNTPQISLVATCKGRLANLRKCLPTWLDLEGADYEIVIVDYDCPDGVGDYVQSHRAGWLRDCRVSNIKVVRVDNKPYFNLNDARNRGLKAADAPIVMMIDSDISISRTDLLPWLLQRFATGVEFVGNLAVLPAQYVESHMFYRWKYAVDVEAPLLLPMVAEHLGLTGTACFRAKAAEDCGGYDPVINQSGYGSDDIEFYLRYLNRPCHGAGQPPQTTFEEGLSRVGYFPERALETEDNDEEVKQRFYTQGLEDSKEYNKRYIARTVQALSEGCADRISASARERLILGKGWPVPLLERLPDWFPRWFYYWYSVVLAENGSLDAHRREFPSELFEVVDSGGRRADRNRDCYRMATIAFRLGYAEQAGRLFEALLAENSGSSFHLLSGAHYYLGQLMQRQGLTLKAKGHFQACLTLNPEHRGAKAGLEAVQGPAYGQGGV